MSSNTKLSEGYLNDAYDHYNILRNTFELLFKYNDKHNKGKSVDAQPYWRLGCVFNSMIDFLNLAVPANIVSLSEAQAFLCNATQYYLDNHFEGGWYDDWSWWCTATAKIFDTKKYGTLFGTEEEYRDLHTNFKRIYTETFNFVTTGQAPSGQSPDYMTGTFEAYNYVIDQAKNKKISKSAQNDWKDLRDHYGPVWNLGCWDGPIVPGKSDPRSMQAPGIQDTLMSALVYIFTLRTLGNEDETTKQLPGHIDSVEKFFQHWMSSSPPPDESQMKWDQQKIFNWLIVDEAGLFRERVGRFNDPNSRVLAFDSTLAWAGDQGLMLEALTLLHKSQREQTLFDGKDPLKIIEAVVNGIFNHSLVNYRGYPNVIMSWWHIDDKEIEVGFAPANNNSGDFYSGTGVLMRGLLEAMSISDKVKKTVKDNIKVLQSTIKMYTHMSSDPNTSDPEVAYANMFYEFNILATYLVASQAVKPD